MEREHVYFSLIRKKIELHQPVAKRASILVVIKMVLEYVKSEVKLNKSEIKQLSVLSDSQSAVGILTLGWQNTQELLLRYNRQ